jgi:hypothetical protein
VGSVATSSSLPVPYSGSVGDGYVVADTAHLWFWNGFSWVDAGNIQGPQGATGVQGSTGATGFGATGSQGSTGATGPQGLTGGISFSVINSGASAYQINGRTNPTINLIKGFTYYFNVNAVGHPFWIKTAQVTGTGSAYSTGVTNNGAQSGTITFTVPLDAPATLYYICQFHGSMVGQFSISDSAPTGATGATGPVGSTGPIGTTVPATTATIGGLIVGHNLAVTTSGVVSSVGSAIGDNPPVVGAVDGDHWWDSEIGRGFVYYQGNWVEYSPQSLPGTATTASLGLVQIGSGINLNNGIISVQGGFGATGATGPSGSNGQNGATGSTGPQGATGMPGADGATGVFGDSLLAVYSDIIPATSSTYSLGSPTHPWKSLYISTQTIYIDNVALSLNTANNTLVIGTGSQAINLATEQFVIANQSTSTLVNGDLTVSLDSSGTLHTPLLIPKSFTAILVPVYGFAPSYNPPGPTGGNAWTYEVHFQVTMDGQVETLIDAPVWPSNPGYKDGDSWTFTEADHGIPGYTFTLSLSNITYPGPAGWTANALASQPPEYPSTVKSPGAVKLSSDTASWTFGTNGQLTLPNGSTIGTSNGWLGVPITTARGTIFLGNSPAIGQPDHFHIMKSGQQDLDLFLGDDSNYVKLPNDGGVEISSSEIGSQHNWRFGTDGVLTFPNGLTDANSQIYTTNGGYQTIFETFNDGPGRGSGQKLTLDYDDGAVKIQSELGTEWKFWYDGLLQLPSGAGFARGDNGQLKTNDGTTLSLDFRDTSGRGFYTNGDGFSLRGNGSNTWQFGTDGTLTLPGPAVAQTSYSRICTNGSFLNLDVQYGSLGNVYGGARLGTNSTDPVDIITDFNGAHNTWRFGSDGSITFPNNTVQTTAFQTVDTNVWVEDFSSANNNVVQGANSVEYDADGNSIAVFSITDPNNTFSDTLVAKFDTTGTKQWEVIFQGGIYTDGWGLAVDAVNNKGYVAGRTTVSGGYDQSLLTKIDLANGNIVWSKQIDFEEASNSPVVDVGTDGNPVMVGYAHGNTDDYVTVTKLLASDGSVVWCKTLDGYGDERASGMAIGPNNEVVVIGYEDQLSELDPAVRRVLVAKFDVDGTLQWQKSVEIDSGKECSGADADIDSMGNIYVCGNYYDINDDNRAMFMFQMDGQGVGQWTRRVKGNCNDSATSIVVGPDDHLYLSAVTGNNGTEDFSLVLAKYNRNGTVVWQRLLDNITTWTFGGDWWFGAGGGSNLAVKPGYVIVAGGFADPFGTPPRGILAQVNVDGTQFATGNYDFKSASFSGLLTGAPNTVTDTRTVGSGNPGITDFNPDYGYNQNQLTGSLHVAGDQKSYLINGNKILTLQDTGLLVNETGRNITGELDRQTDNGNYFGSLPIAIKNATGYKRLLGVTNSAQTWLRLNDVGTQLGINSAWITGMVIDYQAQSSNFSGGNSGSMVGQIIIATNTTYAMSVTHSEAVITQSNSSDVVFTNLDLWHVNGNTLEAVRTDSNTQQLDIIWTAKVFVNSSEDYC